MIVKIKIKHSDLISHEHATNNKFQNKTVNHKNCQSHTNMQAEWMMTTEHFCNRDDEIMTENANVTAQKDRVSPPGTP